MGSGQYRHTSLESRDMKDVEFDLREQEVCVNAEFNLFNQKGNTQKDVSDEKDAGGGTKTCSSFECNICFQWASIWLNQQVEGKELEQRHESVPYIFKNK